MPFLICIICISIIYTGGELGGLGDGPQNLRWGTANAFVLQYFEKNCYWI